MQTPRAHPDLLDHNLHFRKKFVSSFKHCSRLRGSEKGFGAGSHVMAAAFGKGPSGVRENTHLGSMGIPDVSRGVG